MKSNDLDTSWMSVFDEREKRLIYNCVDYARRDPAGLPGHNLMLIVEKMAKLLDDNAESQKIEWQDIDVPGPIENFHLGEEDPLRTVWVDIGGVVQRTDNFQDDKPDWVIETDPEKIEWVKGYF